MKVFNTGKRPIVYLRTKSGPKVIHPGKSVDLPEKTAKAVIMKFEGAAPSLGNPKAEKKTREPERKDEAEK